MPGFGRRLLEVVLLLVAPLALPVLWLAGAALLLSRKGARKGRLVTLALCPVGLLLPLWFYGAGTDPAQLSPHAAYPVAAALLATNLVAAWRVLGE